VPAVLILAAVFYFYSESRNADPEPREVAASLGSAVALTKAREETQQSPSKSRSEPAQEPVRSQVTASTEASDADVSNDEAYCRLLKSNVHILLQGELKMISSIYGSDEDGNSGFWAVVQSSECPPKTFSKVQIDSFGRVRTLIDCQRTTPEQIALKAGVQGAAMKVPVGAGEVKLSIYRGGFFVVDCLGELRLTRDGDFKTQKGVLKQKECVVLGNDGEAFRLKGENFDEQGCTKSGRCLALVYPKDPSSVEIIDRVSLRAKEDPLKYPVAERQLFLDTLEDFSDPRVGPLGPDWEKIPNFDRPNCE
jgi:hypothetical protein